MMILALIVAGITSCNAVNSINFLTIGDWGGAPIPPYVRRGQLASVTGMDKIATALNADFIVALGDNFYTQGVDSVDSSRFENTFNSVYSPASLQKDWYVIAGNHDHNGNVSAQIEYSGVNSRWKFPSEYHTKSFTAGDVTMDMILIDTVNLVGMNPITDENAEGYFDPLPEVPRSYGETQWDWLEAQLAASTADYIMVGGHYPVYSACKHGNTDTLVTNLKPLLEKYGAHYMSGHDHCMEHLVETGSVVNYFLTGMGDGCCYFARAKDGVPSGSLKWYIARENSNDVEAGFTSFTVTKESMTAIFYDEAGNVLYSAPSIAPRVVAKRD